MIIQMQAFFVTAKRGWGRETISDTGDILDQRWLIQQQVLPDGVQSLTADEPVASRPRGDYGSSNAIFNATYIGIGNSLICRY